LTPFASKGILTSVLDASGPAQNQSIPMADFKFDCPECAQHLKCDEQFSGRQIQCPACNKLIRIPSAPGQTEAFKPQAGMTWVTHVPRTPPPKN